MSTSVLQLDSGCGSQASSGLLQCSFVQPHPITVCKVVDEFAPYALVVRRVHLARCQCEWWQKLDKKNCLAPLLWRSQRTGFARCLWQSQRSAHFVSRCQGQKIFFYFFCSSFAVWLVSPVAYATELSGEAMPGLCPGCPVGSIFCW
jgi:hypothetical protein